MSVLMSALSTAAGTVLMGEDRAVDGLSADSREIEPGFLFAALSGVNSDGAAYIEMAKQRGAAGLLVSDKLDEQRCLGLPYLRSDNPRRAFSLMASHFYGRQPDCCVAVTGTNGKSSVVSFIQQIWQRMGFVAASMGTIGLDAAGLDIDLHHTTPDPVKLHASLAQLAKHGFSHLALEASSHGLEQHRLDGVRLAAAGFTNITHDHLDYHPTFEAYLDAKMQLFERLLEPGCCAVINADMAQADTVIARCRARGLQTKTIGHSGDWLRLEEITRQEFAQCLHIKTDQNDYQILLPLAGGFQAANALMAAALVIAAGGDEATAIRSLEYLRGAVGRLELVARSVAGTPVFVDYAHTPDALETALTALRPFAGDKLHVVFGCGGDRDKAKRPQMGRIAGEKADKIYVTDDNPRHEDAQIIRSEILKACPGAVEIGNRAEAIEAAITAAAAGDVVLIAGKGHETGQTVGDKVLPFSDQDTARAVIAKAKVY